VNDESCYLVLNDRPASDRARGLPAAPVPTHGWVSFTICIEWWSTLERCVADMRWCAGVSLADRLMWARSAKVAAGR